MSHEIEAMVLDSLAGSARRAKGHGDLPRGAPCPNCGTRLEGPWCHGCGQKAEEYHRSIWHLIAEAFEGLTHFDGRFWQTLPPLIRDPGRLTRDYIDGKRARQIPPFRMFLVVLLLVFFAGSWSMDANHVNWKIQPVDPTKGYRIQTRTEDGGLKEVDLAQLQPKATDTASQAWLRERARHAIQEPQTVFAAIEHWSHRFAILMLPIAALLLSLIFAFRKGSYVFDHLIFSMHSLSFQGLLLTLVFLGGLVLDGAGWLLLAAPVHLFFHMRGVYRTGVFGTLVRMFALFIGSTVAFGALMGVLFFVGMATAH